MEVQLPDNIRSEKTSKMIISLLEELRPQLNKLLKLAEKINTYQLNNQIRDHVYGCFRTIVPLSRTFKVTSIKVEHLWGYDAYLAIGKWIRWKIRWYKYGDLIYENEFFDVIREYGDQLVPYVRKTIRSIFAELVELTKQIKIVPDFGVQINFAPRTILEYELYSGKRGVDFKTSKINTLIIKTDSPLHIDYLGMNEKLGYNYITLNSKHDLHLIAQLINELEKLYEIAYEEVREARKHDLKILKRMEDLVLPFKLSRALS